MHYLDSGMFYLWGSTSQLSMNSFNWSKELGFHKALPGTEGGVEPDLPQAQQFTVGITVQKVTACKVSLQAGKKKKKGILNETADV